MKITEQDQNELESLLKANLSSYGCKTFREFFQKCRENNVKVIKSEATAYFNKLLQGAALMFVCDTIYDYANDEHLATFYRKLFQKYSK